MTKRDREAAERRALLARPYAAAHDASVRRVAAKPRDLLGWFLRGFRAEMPEAIHASGVWRDTKRRDDLSGYQPVGGSATGTPRTNGMFQALTETVDIRDAKELARLTESGVTVALESYQFPMRAALARLRGRGPATTSYPFMAAALERTAFMDGDWSAACATLGIIEPVREPYIRYALERLWERYDPEPPARTIRDPRPVEQEGLAPAV